MWGALEERDREKGKYLLATVHLLCPSYLLGTPRAGCLGLFPPHRPTTFQTPAQLGTWLGIWCWGEFLFPGWLEELLMELLGNRNLGSGKGFTGPSEWSCSVWRLPGAPHLLLDSAGGGLRVSRERAGNDNKLFGV